MYFERTLQIWDPLSNSKLVNFKNHFFTDQDPKFWEVAEREEKAKKKFARKVQLQPTEVQYPATVPKTQTGTGAFPCHLCSKSYDRKATLEKHLASHSRTDSTVNRILQEDPSGKLLNCEKP